MSELTHKDLHWFHLANACPVFDFYEFKDRFLRRFGTPDGWDLQIIEYSCWTCNGTGMYSPDNICRSCGGDGIYRTARIWLERIIIGERAYHIPYKGPYVNPEINLEPRNVIEGKIKKGIRKPHPLTPLFEDIIEEVPFNVGWRSYRRLLLRHEPMRYYWIVMDGMKGKISRHRAKLEFCLIKLRNKLDLFKSVPEHDEVPF
jgi:hypothetical protein